MLPAQAALAGADVAGPLRTRLPRVLLERPPQRLGVEHRVGVDAVAEVPVLGAGFLHVHRPVLDEDPPQDHGPAFGAEALDGSRQPPGHGLNRLADEGVFRAARPVGLTRGKHGVGVDLAVDAAPAAAVRQHQLPPDALEQAVSEPAANGARGWCAHGQGRVQVGEPAHAAAEGFQRQ